MCYAPLESSQQAGHFDYRHVHHPRGGHAVGDAEAGLKIGRLPLKRERMIGNPARVSLEPMSALYRLYIGIADGMPIARVWACRYSK